MKKGPLLLGGLGLAALAIGVIVMSEGESHAASGTPGLTGGTPAARALLAVGTADATVIERAALLLNSEAPAIAAGLVSTANAIRDINLPVQYRAMALQAISGLDVPSIYAMADNARNLKSQQSETALKGIAAFVDWLKQGAPQKKASEPVSVAAPAGTTVASPAAAIVNQVAQVTDTTEQEAAKIAAIIGTKDSAKIAAAIEIYKRSGNQRAVEILQIALAELAKESVGTKAPEKPVQTIVTAVTEAKAQAATPPAAKPTPQVETPPEKPEKVLAGKVALALKTATKSKATGLPVPDSARQLTEQFQIQENLDRKDGAYGTETALSLAERYGIVPPTPLSWGKKGGDYKTLVADKKLYRDRLTKLMNDDPPRREEWARAISQVKS
jgi:hypothetical protein